MWKLLIVPLLVVFLHWSAYQFVLTLPSSDAQLGGGFGLMLVETFLLAFLIIYAVFCVVFVVSRYIRFPRFVQGVILVGFIGLIINLFIYSEYSPILTLADKILTSSWWVGIGRVRMW